MIVNNKFEFSYQCEKIKILHTTKAPAKQAHENVANNAGINQFNNSVSRRKVRTCW